MCGPLSLITESRADQEVLTCPDHLLPSFPFHFEGYSCHWIDLRNHSLIRVKLQTFIIRIFHFKILEFTKKRSLKDTDQLYQLPTL